MPKKWENFNAKRRHKKKTEVFVSEEEKIPFYEAPLTTEEKNKFSSLIKNIKEEKDQTKKEGRLDMLISLLLVDRLERELRKEGKQVVNSIFNGDGVIKKEGYQWKTGERKEKELKIWRHYKEKDNGEKWIPKTIIIGNKQIEALKDKLREQIFE